MRYYVVADPHAFYTKMVNALDKKGFFSDIEPHKLLICGDLMDRGKEAIKMQKLILDLMEDDKVILIRGNHEDLMIDLIRKWEYESYKFGHHISNGTVDTVKQLTGENYINYANHIEIKE